MPVDNRVLQRYRLLDKYFREPDGNTYDDLISKLEDEGIEVAERTIKADKKYFEDHYGALFSEGLRRGKQALVRYEDVSKSVFSELLSEDEKDIINKLTEKLQVHDDIPQYQWMLFLLDSLSSIEDVDDLEDYLMFDNNLYLEGLDNLRDIMEACVKKYPITLQYAPFRFADSPRTYTVSPYLLKQFNNRWYLICKRIGFDTLTTYPLDRIIVGSVARADDYPYDEPNRYAIGDNLYQSVGVTSVFSSEFRQDVVLKVSKERFPYLKSKPIIPGQQVIEERCTEDEKYILLEGITINKELESLILSFGCDAEVIEPESLRSQIALKVGKLAEMYREK